MHKILLIDDEEINLKVLSMSLKSDGYNVLTALNGEKGLKVFKKESPHIVITDIKMPGLNGLEVLKRIKFIEPETEVIIITGHGHLDSAIEALHLGASDFINKPINDQALKIALKRAKGNIYMRKRLKEYTDDLEMMVKIATEELQRKSDFQAKLIKSSNNGIVASDDDWKVVIFNPGAEKIFGYSRSQVIGKMDIRDLYPPEVTEKMTKDKAEKELPWKEMTITSKDGNNIPVRFSETLLYEKKQMVGSVAFIQDLREIKRLERELVNSERLAAIGQTVAGMAHCIKNILHGFKGGSYIIDTAFVKNDTDKLQAGWQMIERNIERMSELVLDLLSYSKGREPEYDKISTKDILDEVCGLLNERAKKNKIELIKEYSSSIDVVVIDPKTVYRSLMNLISNAIDACIFDEDSGKQHTVVVTVRDIENNILEYEVKDNGSGMDDEVKAKLFASFFSTKGAKGTGLGLLVTRKLIEEHNGSIGVSSTQGEGTTVTFRLPYELEETKNCFKNLKRE